MVEELVSQLYSRKKKEREEREATKLDKRPVRARKHTSKGNKYSQRRGSRSRGRVDIAF
jgi:hypothetical protein